MEVLVVYAHPNPKSFNHAILESFTEGLREGGHTFKVDDLYAADFDPLTKPPDFAQFAGGQMPQDVLDQQAMISGADALVFIAPVWWWSYPAILKGWFDRVMSYGFAYRFAEKGVEGLLKHEKALIINTTLGSEEMYRALGAADAMKTTMVDLGVKWCGIQNVEQTYFHSPARVDDETRSKYLEKAYRLGKEF